MKAQKIQALKKALNPPEPISKFDWHRMTDDELRRLAAIQKRVGDDVTLCTDDELTFLVETEIKCLIK
jgi:L-alanine-DL-glutamate epimerase-like enolase superfamily enzyme